VWEEGGGAVTPEERAAQIMRSDQVWPVAWLEFCRVLEERIAAAIREAIAEEREACAAVCEESTARCSVPDDLAAAIRARGDKQ
jgi:hypothetical protein